MLNHTMKHLLKVLRDQKFQFMPLDSLLCNCWNGVFFFFFERCWNWVR